jgi:hypothetical protein
MIVEKQMECRLAGETEVLGMIVEKQMECRLTGKPKLSEKTCPSATFVHHKIPHDQTRVF